MSTTSCRMYENRFPEVDELVVVNVRQIQEMGAYVKLLEYDNIEGMVLLSELSRRRIRSVQKHIRVGRNEVVVVLRVDKEKGYIDLSKRRVSPEDVIKCEERFNKSKAVHSIMRHIAEKHNVPLETMYTSIGWPLYRRYGHAYDAFKLAISNAEHVFEGLEAPKPGIIDDLLGQISRRLTPQPIKIRADVEVTCFGYDGINAIKAALKSAEDLRTEEVPIKVKLVAPPLYVLLTNALDKSLGLKKLEEAIVNIEKVISAANGTCIVKMKPKAVSETDELELADLMKKFEKENAEISGDEEDDQSGSE
ncbi:translation initiation factor eIF2 alpha subunit [Schizosaccharomyces octosporus yFS286]|uniref:Eukaryotic translation initiation factor 2 subunit alpha n=1 Tax=Schizosaccharomyces octosporus (strain yFS286) TaxID=483514 RepID=S9RB85_SCHOY|nr:translation initiation factor eIF2 alpha subunit [Schizosaccharomyces octosporus yFS286]EPX71399.1 translation initiation factor eIF2 alpha subunit [Schizosaccharomyces octosporus yFS286]